MISVKANQRTLSEQLHQLAQTDSVFSLQLDFLRTRDRQTTRIASVFALPEHLKALSCGEQQGVEITRRGSRGGEPYFERRYYITSWIAYADVLPTRIRADWGLRMGCIGSKMWC